MASLEDHCLDCKIELGKEFREVHIWLDELYKYSPGNFLHRAYRHHKEGIQQIKDKFGDLAEEAAKIHIKRDFPGLSDIPTIKDWENPDELIKKSDFYMEIVNGNELPKL